MSNMSYCRFENTQSDLLECLDALEDGDGVRLSNTEAQALAEMVDTCRSILSHFPNDGQGIYNAGDLPKKFIDQDDDDEDWS